MTREMYIEYAKSRNCSEKEIEEILNTIVELNDGNENCDYDLPLEMRPIGEM